MLDNYRIIQKYKGPAVQGNWEYWLTHPERDHNTYQVKYAEQLKQRRQLFRNKDNNAMLEYMTQHTDLIRDSFTLFHGCTYPCHGNSDYQPHPCECYLFPRDLNTVTRGLFGSPQNLTTPHFLFGHTHIPGFFTYSLSSMKNMWQHFTLSMQNRPISYGDSTLRFGINPGTAGIKTRRFPRTALLLDTTRKNFTYLVDTEA